MAKWYIQALQHVAPYVILHVIRSLRISALLLMQKIKETANGVMYVSGKYSDDYLECLEDGVRFVIRDEDSVVYKRQCVCKRVPVMHNGKLLERDTLVQLKIKNLEPYF